MDENNDRNVVPFDEKGRILDFFERPITPPESGIYDGQLRYYAASPQWATIIEGLIDFLATPAAWDDSVTDESHHAIQQILIFEEGIELPMSIDYDALKQAISEGMYEFGNNIAKQIVSGRTNNISVDEDGSVSDPTTDPTGGAGLPEDDPDTFFSETKAALYGAAYETAKAVELFLDKLDTYYGSSNGSPVTPLADTQANIKDYFACDDSLMDSAIANYYTYRTSVNTLSFGVSSQLIGLLYCNGVNERTLNQWLIDSSGYNQAKRTVISDLVTGLAQEFWDYYYNRGLSLPSTAYLETTCEPTQTETFTITALATNFTAANSVKVNHRLKITVTGKFTDADGDTRDMWWLKLSGQTPTFTSAVTITTQGLSPSKPTSSQVPYNSNGSYVFTIDTLNTGSLIFNIPNTSMGAPITGSITVTVEDLGLFQA